MKRKLSLFSVMMILCCMRAFYVSADDGVQVLLPDNPQHPYVCVTRDIIENTVKPAAEKTPGDHWYRRVKTLAEDAAKHEPLRDIGTDRNVALDLIRKEKSRIEALGMMYLITGEELYLEKGAEKAMALTSLEVPFPDHYLYLGELAYTYAVAYDWLYDGLTDSQRSEIAAAVKAQCIDNAGGHIINGTGFAGLTTNLNTVSTGGITTAAMAVCEEFPELSEMIIEGAVRNTPRAVRAWEPDGIYPEGSMYWDYGTSYLAYMMSTMDNLFGSDFGLSEIEGFKLIGSFPRFINGSSGLDFNFGDSIETPCAGAQLYWFAGKNGRPGDALPRWERRAGGGVYDLIWYNEEQKNAGLSEAFTDELKGGSVNIAVFRSEDRNGIYASLKGGDNRTPHTDLDIGSFVLDAMGERWISDLGPEPYVSDYFVMDSQNSPRWTYYAKRAEAHNIPVINPGYTADQNVSARCGISEFVSDGASGYALIDMTAAYPDARSVKRGMAVTDDESRVIIRDEIRLKEPGTVYWMLHTASDVTIADGGSTVYLKRNGKGMKITLLTGNGVFEAENDKPLETSPKPPENINRTGYTRIYIKLESVLNTDISVLFTPLYSGYEEKLITSPKNLPLSQWSGVYGRGDEIKNTEGIKNRRTDAGRNQTLLHFENTDCAPEEVICFENAKPLTDAAVYPEGGGTLAVDFGGGLSAGKRYTIDFKGKIFSFKTQESVFIDDFEEGRGPAGAAAYSDSSGFISEAFIGSSPNYTVVSGDSEKYGADDTVIYMGGSQEAVKLVYRKGGTKKICVSGYTRNNSAPECDVLIYGADNISDYNDMRRWTLLEAEKSVSSYTVGNGYNIVTYTAAPSEPTDYIMVVMARNDGSAAEKIYLPQLRDIRLEE